MFTVIRQRLKDAATIKTLSVAAEAHANGQGQRHPGAEHFVLAALDLPDATASQVFEQLGLTPQSFRSAIEQQYRTALASLGVSVDGLAGFDSNGLHVPPGRGLYQTQASAQAMMTVLTREVMEHEQRRSAAAPLLGAHILLAASAATRGVCARALESMGVTSAQLATAAREVLARRSDARRN